MANALISKIKLANGTVVDLKDAAGRADFAALLGDNTLAALKSAAWKDAQTTWDATKDGELPTTGAVKSYVDAQIESIPTFECIVCPAEASKIPAGAEYVSGSTKITGTMAASADTYKKIYLVKNDNAGAGAYVEYLTIRSGSAGSYTYSWEAIGTTAIDLSAYLKTADAEAWTVAGTAFGSGHAVSAADIKSALNLGSLADKDSASGTVTYDKTSSITMNAVEVSGNAAVTTTSASANITYGAYTPAGNVTGTVTAKGGVDVTLTQTSTAASLSFSDYTPAGTIAAAASDGSFTALKTAAFAAATSDTGVQITGTVAAPGVALNYTAVDVLGGVSKDAVLPSFSEGEFSAGAVDFGSFNGGSVTTIDTTKFSGGSLGNATTSTFATDGILATVNTSAASTAEDYELLVFTAVSQASGATAAAVTAQGTFTGAAFSDGFYSVGSAATWSGSSYTAPTKAADTWDAGSAATFSTAKVVPSTVTATADAPEFTGGYFKVATTEDTALKKVEFSGTKAANALVTGATYDKATVSSATFTGSSADITATFAGTESSEVIATAVEYQKANSSAAFDVTVTPTVSNISFSSATTTVTVS